MDDLASKGVVSRPPNYKLATGWIHYPVIADKKYVKKIPIILDTRSLAKSVNTVKFPIPTPMELGYQ